MFVYFGFPLVITQNHISITEFLYRKISLELRVISNFFLIFLGANILRDTKGNVKLADFGASKRLQVMMCIL